MLRQKGLICGLLLWLLLLCGCRAAVQPEPVTLRVAVPYEEQLYGNEHAYYKAWLEEKTGYTLEFSYIPHTYSGEYLRTLLYSGENSVDAVLFSPQNTLPSKVIDDYGMQGKLLALDERIAAQDTHLSAAMERFSPYDLRRALTARDGHIYYMPAVDNSNAERYAQTLWINTNWLDALNLPIPSTTGGMRETLLAFKSLYPDALPIVGSADQDSTLICHFFMNSFAVCDPANQYMAVEDGQVYFAPATDQWREGLRYCHALYSEGLLPRQSFTFTTQQLVGIVNDPRDLVGMFAAKSATDVLFDNSPELLVRYLVVPPLQSARKGGIAIPETRMPRVGGVVLASSQHPAQTFRLLDLMCSEEAFLAGHYGQQGVDWDLAAVGDISIFGDPAVITMKSPQWLHRKEIPSAMGPYIGQKKYVDGVSWSGHQINQSGYLQARVYRAYAPYEPKEHISAILLREDAANRQAALAELSAYAKGWMLDFMRGQQNINSDAVWARYLEGLSALDMESLVQAVQTDYLPQKSVGEE